MESILNQNEAETIRRGSVEWRKSLRYGPLTFERWLLILESNHRVLESAAQTPQNIARYENALRQWKEAGYPYPGDWPDGVPSQMEAFTESWISQNEKSSTKIKQRLESA